MADDPKKPERTTSAAKEFAPDAKLSRVQSLKQEFDRAKAAQHKTFTRDAPARQTWQHAPAAKPQLRPKLPGAKGVDRNAFAQDQAKQDKLAHAQQNKKDVDRAKQQNLLHKHKDRDDEKDRER